MRGLVHDRQLHTVCEEALCPNLGRCWEEGRATLMILGEACTRNCSFCNVHPGAPGDYDEDEPRRVAEAAREMGLKDVVLTSVTRDDLPDGGAAIWAESVRAVREAVPGVRIEVLVPDFGGSAEALATVLETAPDVFGHNLETVKALYARARPQADYQRSLDVLRQGHEAGLITKSGIMLGLGETKEQVLELMRDARAVSCNILYVGQYLQPSSDHIAVEEYVTPEQFDAYGDEGKALGFDVVVSAPLVRSSYHTDEQAEFVGNAGRGVERVSRRGAEDAEGR